MLLHLLLENTGISARQGTPDIDISAITNDSRQTVPGAIFFALPGTKTDGYNFVRQALENGAAAIISAVDTPAELHAAFPKAVFLKTADLQTALSKAAANFYGHPSRKIRIFGITGTKGKTTTAYLLENILRLVGARPGIIGTIDYRVDGRILAPAANTTPLAHTLQELLAQMAAADALTAVMEVSSHALALGRVEDVQFDCAIFTNLQSDHLDFHKDRETYFQAKARLFDLLEGSDKKNKYAVINTDDERAAWLLKRLKGKVHTITYGIDNSSDFRAGSVEILAQNTRFTLKTAKETVPVTLNLLGRHNVYNALAAIAAAVTAGIPPRDAVNGVQALANVPGRLERVAAGQDFTVFVDYAHTGAALENVLSSLALMPHKRIITVFGCGGDRDRTKRAPMGAVSCALSDQAIVTSDNPRTEAPDQIFSDIERGIAGKFTNYEVIPDRKAAITKAVTLAGKGDIILIAGKGHETYQILGDRTVNFSDRETAAEAIREKLRETGTGEPKL
ncbi:MAG: UDP-N-acetylmuramoyl-L-alanyl-D-glutamate--2,6-diaminopimelate ligase [Elusimicrobia bacterium RIFOXYA2_FULL_58_8]|nr:MAG: UDP-N-acetylmuramoyl-L-alanyl-D-glutamate--2,6-diaminopimelate ligase [Elusimicrobia bacterium RIFOXYA12_FULL_57_11]OGS17347.1 MAG: UDP-N-acetylmuramoyl-L-alanyl-D-glutamate--2,6-diaminopimelate ligase [Elusimicrobia bacterium RIFOXYA2_FULL_58_8]